MTQPDPKYNNVLIAKFINHVMRDGKRLLAEDIVYKALEHAKEETEKNPLEIFSKAIKNVTPRMETRPTRVGGATYQVPREVKKKRGTFLAMKWIIDSAKNKKGKPMAQKLTKELIAAANGEGEAMKKKETVHKMAEANKSFAHFAR